MLKSAFIILLLSASLTSFSQTQDDAIMATIEQTGAGMFDVVFTFEEANTGIGNPIQVYLRVPEDEDFAGGVAPVVVSSYGLAFVARTEPFEGNIYYQYQGQPSINLANWNVGDRLIAGSFTAAADDDTNQVGLSGGDFGPDPFDSGAQFIWSGTALLTDNTSRNLVSWPIASSIQLPIEWSWFTAQAFNKASLLNWQTQSESYNQGFQIQHSPDGQIFTEIGFVSGRNTPTTYTFTHTNPTPGTNFYRLKQQDVDGTTTLSEVRTVVFAGSGSQLSIAPNPTTDFITVRGLDIEAVTDIRVYDQNGKELSRSRTSNRLDVRHLPNGLYSVVVINGNVRGAYKIAIQR